MKVVSLRAHARALLSRGPWAIRPETLRTIAQVARAADPMMVAAPLDADVAAGGRSPQVRGGVAVVDLVGMVTPEGSLLDMLFGLGGGGLKGVRQQLREAAGNDDVSAIVLNVDSPGGLIDLVPETAAELRAIAEQKPVHAIANTQAGSAAYWLAAQATSVSVTPSGSAGSIGVYTMHVDESQALAQEGLDVTLIYAGKHKVDGHPFGPLEGEALTDLQERIDARYTTFVADVAKGRGVTPAKVRAGYGEGRMMLAADAVSAGLADRVETLDQLVARIAGPGSSRRRGARADAVDLQVHGADLEVEVVVTEPAPTVPVLPSLDPAVAARLAELNALPHPTAL